MAKKKRRMGESYIHRCPAGMSRMSNPRSGEQSCCYDVERGHPCPKGFDKHTDMNETWNKCCATMDVKNRLRRFSERNTPSKLLERTRKLMTEMAINRHNRRHGWNPDGTPIRK
jgi:hypothetical protein